MTWELRGDRILVEVRYETQRFWLPPSVAARQKALRCRVVQVGPDVVGLKAGDEIIVARPEGELPAQLLLRASLVEAVLSPMN